MDVTSQIKGFKEFIESCYKIDLVKNVQKGKKFLVIDFSKLAELEPDLAELVLDEPEETLKAIELAIEQLDLDIKGIKVRFRNLPSTCNLSIWTIRSIHLNKFISITGYIRKITPVHSKATKIKFSCRSCEFEYTIFQFGDRIFRPKKCSNCKGESFRAIETTYTDEQKLVIEDDPKSLSKPTIRLRRIIVSLKDDLTRAKIDEMLQPNVKVRINGILKVMPVKPFSTENKWLLEANYIELVQESVDTLRITDEEKKLFHEIANSETFFEDITSSMFPNIHGHEVIKHALFLQLIGSPHVYCDNVLEERGHIFILLVSSPGAGKSMFLKRDILFMPRGIYICGRGFSGAGLVAAATKDEDIGWGLEYGAVSIASGSIAALDEIDKTKHSDLEYLNPAMDFLKAPINKAGINTEVPCDTIILAAGNPKNRVFEPKEPVWKQIGLPKDLVDRFDLIFALREPDTDDERRKIAKTILNKYHTETKRKYPLELITKYIAYARTIKPEKDGEVNKYIEDYFVKYMRPSGLEEDERRNLSNRLLPSIIRIISASARARLQSKETVEDAKKAIQILIESLKSQDLIRSDNLVDYEKLEDIPPKSKRDKIAKVLQIIKELEKSMGEAGFEEVMTETQKADINEFELNEIIQRLKNQRDIFEPRNGRFKLL